MRYLPVLTLLVLGVLCLAMAEINPKTCTGINGKPILPGKRFKIDGCNRCTCIDGDKVQCTKKLCPRKKLCSYKGVYYRHKHSFKDDCNTCICYNRQVRCTKMIC